MAMIGKVRRMHRRQNKTVREIARLTSLSRNTIRKYLRNELQDEPKYRSASAPTKLTPFHAALEQALKADAHQPKPLSDGTRRRKASEARRHKWECASEDHVDVIRRY